MSLHLFLGNGQISRGFMMYATKCNGKLLRFNEKEWEDVSGQCLDRVDPSPDRVLRMSKQEIVSLFNWYDFKDPIGNSLTSCEDFIKLVELVDEQRAI
jgi:hypothetical protein